MGGSYFAYGSNLDLLDWLAFCERRQLNADALTPLKKVYLPDNTLALDRFSTARRGGVLNVRAQKGAYVEGYLFEVTPEG